MKIIRAADLFCGAGGTSQGFINACATRNAIPELLAINHWDTAVATHALNHPGVRHLCETLDSVNPRAVVAGGRLDLLCASPECTGHSCAAGGRPKNEQSRATAWHVLRWAEALPVENILIENVKEFLDWGPLTRKGKPNKRKKGNTFRAFINALASLGYWIDYRLLISADYGDPTTRERLFIMARKSKMPEWPKPTHGRHGLPAWRGAREIIDWKLKGKSIFSRKRRLCDNTLRRIAAGLKKFGGTNAEPFLVMLYGTNDARDINRPAPTITGGGNHIGLCEPFIVHTNHAGGDRCHDLEKPLPTVTGGHRGEMALIEPFVIRTDQTGGNGSYSRSVQSPLFTTVSKSSLALVEPFISSYHGGPSSESRNNSLDEPLPTQDTSNRFGLVEPFVVKYYGTGAASDLHKPLATVTSRDRFMLVETISRKPIAELDILFRMLQPHELSAAQGFPSNYRFTGTREEQVKQIGNAVTVNLATALCGALI